MPPDLEFRKDLYRGTAPYYDRYRKPYPGELFEDLLQRTAASGRGRLLDLACGTGQIALPLSSRFDSVVAVDQEPESVGFGKAKCAELGIGNVTWVAGSAETVGLHGRFDLITVGNAFQRLRRDTAASRMFSLAAPRASVALIWADMPWVGELAWQRGLFELFTDWVSRTGVGDRVPPGFKEAMETDPHGQVLRRAGFDYIGRFEFVVEEAWSVQELAGFMYSTSLLSRAALGGSAGQFETDLSRRMLAVEPSGRFSAPASYAYELAVVPAS